jgi:uncharacterized protein YjiS (DUF1127 family)
MRRELNVLVNCPFDDNYKPLFEAIYFTVAACGYSVRCALEEDDASEIRFSKLCRLIAECPRSVHDLSRTQLSDIGLSRFNMPFELGLMMGAKHFGGKRHQSKSALVMVSESYKLPAYLSDSSGSDPHAHGGQPSKIIEIVRRYLHSRPLGAPLPGAQHIADSPLAFQTELPKMAGELNIELAEVDAYSDYRTYAHFVTAFLSINPVL